MDACKGFQPLFTRHLFNVLTIALELVFLYVVVYFWALLSNLDRVILCSINGWLQSRISLLAYSRWFYSFFNNTRGLGKTRDGHHP